MTDTGPDGGQRDTSRDSAHERPMRPGRRGGRRRLLACACLVGAVAGPRSVPGRIDAATLPDRRDALAGRLRPAMEAAGSGPAMARA